MGDLDIASHIGARIKDGSSKDEKTYGRLKQDAYGKPYQMVRAEDLAPVLKRFMPDHPSTAYVTAMSPDSLIVLDWH